MLVVLLDPSHNQYDTHAGHWTVQYANAVNKGLSHGMSLDTHEQKF